MPLLSNDLIADSDLHLINLPAPGEWVKVKRRLSRGDEIDLQKRLITVAVFDGDLPSVPDANKGDAIEAMEFMTLEKAIVAWSFDADLTPANIRALDPESVAKIKEELNTLYPAARTDDERKNSQAPGGAPAEARAKSLSRSNGSA